MSQCHSPPKGAYQGVRKLIFGCGYLGGQVSREWVAGGAQVYAVTRSRERASLLCASGVIPIQANVLDPRSLIDLPAVDTVLYAIGFDRSEGRSIREVYVDGLRNALDALQPCFRRLIYASSTGVYGQRDGEWVDEASRCDPARQGGIACRKAEELLQEHRLGARSVILRLAGLYGPGRIPRRRDLLAGRTIAAPIEGYLNLVHVDDAVQAIVAAERLAPLPSVYCVSDGSPVVRGDYYRELTRQLGAPAPRFVEPDPDSPASRRAGSSKRVSNDRLLHELQVRLRYPSYREGLSAILASTTNPQHC